VATNSRTRPGSKIWVSQYQMRVAGPPAQSLRNARHESQRASKLLSQRLGADIPVVSCIVVLTGSLVPEVTIRQMPDDVMVLDKWDTPRWFRRRPSVYTPDQVEQIYAVARRSDTWTGN